MILGIVIIQCLVGGPQMELIMSGGPWYGKGWELLVYCIHSSMAAGAKRRWSFGQSWGCIPRVRIPAANHRRPFILPSFQS